MVAAVGVASMLIALSFAEVGSRFDGTGGPYLYTRAAFGRFAAFEVGWMMWFTRAASWASVINVLVVVARLLLAGDDGRRPRGPCSSRSIIGVDRRHQRPGHPPEQPRREPADGGQARAARPVRHRPGMFFVDWSRLARVTAVSLAELSSSALLLIFAFGGYEVIPVPAGEAQGSAPRRAVRAHHDDRWSSRSLHDARAGRHDRHLAGARRRRRRRSLIPPHSFLGAAGAAMITLGAVLSTSGNNMGQALSGSRNLFALAEQGDLPGVLRPRPPALSHAGERDPRHVRGRAAARRLRHVSDDGGGERDQPAGRLRRDVRVGAAAPQPGFEGVVRAGDVRRAVRPGHPLAAILIALAILAGARRCSFATVSLPSLWARFSTPSRLVEPFAPLMKRATSVWVHSLRHRVTHNRTQNLVEPEPCRTRTL